MGGVRTETSGTVLEMVNVLRQRCRIVAYLLEEPRDKRTLIADLDIPRSTLDRALRELEVVELVAYTEGEYAVTPIGERIAADFFAFLDRTELVLEMEPFLRYAPIDEFDLDPRALAEAELFVPQPGNPYAMVDQHVRALERMDRGRGVLPLAGLHAHEAAHESIVERGAEAELVVDSDVADVMLTDPAFSELTDEMLATGRFELFVYDGAIPHFVGVFDDETVQLGVDEGGDPRALVETDQRAARAWAHEAIDDYEEQATRLETVERQDAPSRSAYT